MADEIKTKRKPRTVKTPGNPQPTAEALEAAAEAVKDYIPAPEPTPTGTRMGRWVLTENGWDRI